MTGATTSETAVDLPDLVEKADECALVAQPDSSDVEDGAKYDSTDIEIEQPPWDWNLDPQNPYNWSEGKKAMQVIAISSIALLT